MYGLWPTRHHLVSASQPPWSCNLQNQTQSWLPVPEAANHFESCCEGSAHRTVESWLGVLALPAQQARLRQACHKSLVPCLPCLLQSPGSLFSSQCLLPCSWGEVSRLMTCCCETHHNTYPTCLLPVPSVSGQAAWPWLPCNKHEADASLA